MRREGEHLHWTEVDEAFLYRCAAYIGLAQLPRKWNYLCISPNAQWRTSILEGICIWAMGAVALLGDGSRARTTWLKIKRLSLSGREGVGPRVSVLVGSSIDRAKHAWITLGRVKGWLAIETARGSTGRGGRIRATYNNLIEDHLTLCVIYV
jgi:tartrate dehydratase beta subunit/fumarate hydratase class I family protein